MSASGTALPSAGRESEPHRRCQAKDAGQDPRHAVQRSNVGGCGVLCSGHARPPSRNGFYLGKHEKCLEVDIVELTIFGDEQTTWSPPQTGEVG